MSKRFKNLLVLLVFFAGLAVFAYPFVASALNTVSTQIPQREAAVQAERNAKQLAAKKKKQKTPSLRPTVCDPVAMCSKKPAKPPLPNISINT
ncbi:hypothetical protein [Lacticaseibacillus manihotivorans]|uniref:hypothetical protein n=1 Tax=Lacticaseibacillus manihotivorans TaxID=88233 RepID=UPI000A3F58A6|nr:hypothetical protein [Lacticaseibacillus manihotivorans]